MKAVTIHGHGGLEAVLVEEVAEPQAKDDEVLLEVRAAAVNHLDIWVRKGRPGLALKMPHIIGSDASGVVASVGSAVQGASPGDEVVLNPAVSCGACEYCRGGEQSECVDFGIVGMTRPGTFAAYVAVPAANLYPKPAHLNFEEAAAFPLTFVTAWRMLFSRAGLKPGETVLIHGIGGGVALAALKLAKLAGAEVIVSSSSDEKLARAHKLGADHTINYEKETDVAEAAREVTFGRGVDLAVNTVGAATWPVDFAAVRRGGRIVLCGITSGASVQTNLQALYWNQLTVLGSTMGSNEDFRQMLGAVNAAKLKPVIDSVAPLEGAKEAMARMEKGEQFGKIVLKISQ